MRRAAPSLFFPRLWRGGAELHARWGRYWRAVRYLFNLHTLLLAASACFAVFWCDYLNFR